MGIPSRSLKLLLSLVGLAVAQSSPEYFAISVVDDQTGKGVPLVELRTTNEIAYYTDSSGIAAFFEPGLMGQTVYFTVKSDGYEFPQDLLGTRGVPLNVASGGHAQLKIRRTSIAERLYRVTGEGIYRDSVLVGAPVPVKQPLLNGQVMGQDGGLAIPWHGKIYWFWGDTGRPSHPLGNFGTSGATSTLPSAGGLDPNIGVDLDYFVDDTGFSRPMLPASQFPGPGPKWIGGLKVVSDETGTNRLVADYSRIKDLGEAYEQGIAIFNDKSNSFDRLVQFDPHDSMLEACTGGEATRIRIADADYYYQGYTPALCRVRADVAHIKDVAGYEGFSPLVTGTRYSKNETKLDRDADGRLHYAWKPNTPPLSAGDERDLVAAGKMTAREAFFQLRNVDTGKPFEAGPGSVTWNAFRKRWVMIVKETENKGLANHGVIWFAEADTPLGPWVYAKRVVSHEYYNFYNPVQHAFFDQDGGRVIFFEGTYSDFFSAGGPVTPRYNYNQIMYRVDLSDPRLALPVPVYQTRRNGSPAGYALRDEMDAQNAWDRVDRVPFFAIPPGDGHEGLIPIFSNIGPHGTVLSSQPASQAGASPLFYALPLVASPPAAPQQGPSGKWSCAAQTTTDPDFATFTIDLRLEGAAIRSATGADDIEGTFQNGQLRLTLKTADGIFDLAAELKQAELKQEKLSGTWQSRADAAERGTLSCTRPAATPTPESAAIVPLYEYVRISDGSYLYSTSPNLPDTTWKRSAQPLCRVWRNPSSQLFLDPTAKPAPAPSEVDARTR